MPVSDISKADDYVLDRSYTASARLNLQHYYWLEGVDHELLDPKIPLHGTDLKVADVGTGTGIWMLDVASNLPSDTQLDGLDINLSQVPPKEWLPPNMSFHIYDFNQETPANMVEHYDVVHVRHLFTIIKHDDPTSVLQSLLRLLKPGGFLQWGEYNVDERVAVTTQLDCSTSNMEELHDCVKRFLHTPTATWPAKLGDFFSQNGLQDVSCRGRWTKRSRLSYERNTSLFAHEEFINMISSRPDVDDADIKEMRHKLAMAALESRRGAAWSVEKIVAVGRKPSLARHE